MPLETGLGSNYFNFSFKYWLVLAFFCIQNCFLIWLSLFNPHIYATVLVQLCGLFSSPKLDFKPHWQDKYAAAAAKSLQSCPTLCDPIDGCPPGSSIPGILQARTLEWVAISFSNAWKWKVKVELLSRVRVLATPWTVAYQAPPSMGFSRQEYWSGVPLPSLRSRGAWKKPSEL